MKSVWLASVNYRYGTNAFIPYSAGRLWAYAQTIPEIAATYKLCGILYDRDDVTSVKRRLRDSGGPDVLALSCYIWNWEYNKALAYAVKNEWPSCFIILGGPQVPDNSEGFFQEHPYVDLLIHGEGEFNFAAALTNYAQQNWDIANTCLSLNGHTGYSYLNGGRTVKTGPSVRSNNLGQLPSPYLAGIFDNLVSDTSVQWQALQETNRGCIAEGAKILTQKGEKAIEDVVPGDKVLGCNTDTNEVIWNTVLDTQCTGFKPVLKVDLGQKTIYATPDHPFYTIQGWVMAVQLKPGDKVAVLPDLRREQSTLGQSKNLFARVLQGIKGQAYDDLKKAAAKMSNLWRACAEMGQSNMLDSMCIRKDQAEQARGKQSGKAERCKEKNFSDSQEVGTRTIGAYFKSSSGRKNSLLSQTPRGKQVREKVGSFFARVRAAFQICWGWEFLGWTRAVRELPQSGFYPQYIQDTFGAFGKRQVLAQRQAERTSHSQGLQSYGVENNGHLGRRRDGPNVGNEGEKICWYEVVAVSCGFNATVYDLVGLSPYSNFFADGILVHNCPYSCTFCDWGSATFAKVQKFPVDPIKEEIEWFANHKIELLYNADANFGMLEQDTSIAEALVESKRKTGYPQKFRAAYAKKITERVFSVAKMLADAGMSKGATISFQSLNDEVLEAVARSNIPIGNLNDVFARYNSNDIPTYTELILGLPGETYASFADGLERLLQAGQHYGINVYPCMALKNSEMSRPDYVAEYKLRTVRVPMLLLHGIPPADGEVLEFYDLVIETKTMSYEDWRKGYRLAWIIQALHCAGLTDKIAIAYKTDTNTYVRFYEALLSMARSRPETVLGKEYQRFEAMLDRVIAGGNWDTQEDQFGPIAWPPEELAYLHIVLNKGLFYEEIRDWFWWLWHDDVVTWCGQDAWLQQQNLVDPSDFDGDVERWAREAVWYGRKGKKIKRAA
jgi:radical SAM superfamily enzyme YgiQ (UPF0313 family)